MGDFHVSTISKDADKESIEDKLFEAIANDHPVALRSAVEKAQNAGLEGSILNLALDFLSSSEEKKGAATCKLEAAMLGQSEEGLKLAIEQGREAGMTAQELRGAIITLAELRASTAKQQAPQGELCYGASPRSQGDASIRSQQSPRTTHIAL